MSAMPPFAPDATRHPPPRPPVHAPLTAVEVDPIHPRLDELGRVGQVDAFVGGELDNEVAPDPARSVARCGQDRVGTRLGAVVELDRGRARAALDEVERAALRGIGGEFGVAGDGRAGELFGPGGGDGAARAER